MSEWTLKYADARGEMHQQVAEAGSERELRERLTQQGFLIYSIKLHAEAGGAAGERDAMAPHDSKRGKNILLVQTSLERYRAGKRFRFGARVFQRIFGQRA